MYMNEKKKRKGGKVLIAYDFPIEYIRTLAVIKYPYRYSKT